MEGVLTLGEYLRRLRRSAGTSLLQLSETTGISYSHLSRIENDSTLPNTEMVVRLAEVLDGDLKEMLRMAKAVPKIILDRMTETSADGHSTKMLRRANLGDLDDSLQPRVRLLTDLLYQHFDLDAEQAQEIAMGVDDLTQLGIDQQTLLVSMIRSLLKGEGGGRTG